MKVKDIAKVEQLRNVKKRFTDYKLLLTFYQIRSKKLLRKTECFTK